MKIQHSSKFYDNPLIECACGCGMKRLKYDKQGRERHYIYNHHAIGKPNPLKRTKKKQKIIFCGCGCGQTLLKYSPKWKERKYIYGHQNIGRKKPENKRINEWQKNKHWSPKTEFKKGSIPWNKGTIYGRNMSLLSKIKQSQEYIQWRRDIFERDNYQCQICGNKRKIIVHHITPIKEIFLRFKQEFPEKDKKRLYKLSKIYKDFWDRGNGIVVCMYLMS